MRSMRTCLTAAAAVIAALSIAGAAAASTASKPKPPKLAGEVNDKGVGKITGGQADIDAADFFFEKTFLKGKAGSEVAVSITNSGATAHTFTIDAQDIDETLQPGESVDVTVRVPKSGKAAPFYCRFHEQGGMKGAFFSKAGGGAAKRSSKDGGSSSGGGGYDY
jgi:plastocyanin